MDAAGSAHAYHISSGVIGPDAHRRAVLLRVAALQPVAELARRQEHVDEVARLVRQDILDVAQQAAQHQLPLVLERDKLERAQQQPLEQQHNSVLAVHVGRREQHIGRDVRLHVGARSSHQTTAHMTLSDWYDDALHTHPEIENL